MGEHRRDVLILTGNAGVGKSTIARAWAAKRRGAAIAGDDIREWIGPRTLRWAERYQERSVARIALFAAREFLDKGLDVALENVWTPQAIMALRDRLDTLARVRVARLWCTPAENHRRDDARGPGYTMGARIDQLEAELAAMAFSADVVRVDSTEHTPGQTLDAIERLFSA